MTAASLIFFAYIGFDAISTSGEETKNPQRDLPIAILGALGVCTVLYILVALTASAAMPYNRPRGQGSAARRGAALAATWTGARR